MGKKVSRTTFTSRGRIAGLVRDEAPAGTGQNRTSRSANRDDSQGNVDDAIFHRARLVLGENLPSAAASSGRANPHTPRPPGAKTGRAPFPEGAARFTSATACDYLAELEPLGVVVVSSSASSACG